MWFYILVLSLQVLSSSSQHIRNTISGEYHVEWKEFNPCPANQRGTNEIFSDIHLARQNQKLEIIGNLSNAINFDDTIALKVNFAVIGLNGSWIPNFVDMTFRKGCSDGFADLFKEGWVQFMESFQISPACPVPKGFHRTKGFDPDNLLKHSVLPKRFIYGHYKMTMEYYTRQNRLVGCSYLVIDVVPTWQKKKRL